MVSAAVVAPGRGDRRLRLLLVALVLAVVAASPYLFSRGVDHFRLMWPTKINDFDVFYDTASLVLSGDRAHLYDLGYARAPGADARARQVGHFFNPPGHALAFSPLTLLSQRDARRLFAAVSVLAVAIAVTVAGRARDRRVFLLLAAAATVSFLPLYDALYLGHPAPLYALAVAVAMAALASGHDDIGGIATAILVLKPSLWALPAAILALRRRRAFMATLVAAAGLGLLPFVLTGPRSLMDYVDLLWKTRQDAFRLQGETTGGAALMFNWNGFFCRLFSADPSPWLVLPFSTVTLLLGAAAARRRDLPEAYLAGVLVTVLAVPHLLYYDWVVLLPAGLFVAARSRDTALLCLLAALHISINVSTLEHWTRLPASQTSVMIATPMAFAVLAWLALSPSSSRGSASVQAPAPAKAAAAAGA
jgi:hypothetical protein